ncbi:hypothetical protein [Nocardioides sp. YIM 152315]|uniref:hypothetical protein n=1 Tax=Nocardioides sp. YIM 152315 TaxID=3031760 RepID=UPI0023DB2727|nr:hypothetical protein [Nocardioides sp. YIM 152315]MDF1605958.1 hypothetical protein [Nocardioides sp. YIM 152315]
MTTTRATEAADAERHHLHWATALDRLELDVIRAERMLDDPSRPAPEPWDEPLLTGPIPADLRDRAITLRERQRAVQAAIASELGAIGRQHEFANRVDRATRPTRPAVYLDVTA